MAKSDTNKLVAEIPRPLHREVRLTAAREGKTIRQVVIEALERRVEQGAVSTDDARHREEVLERIRARYAETEPVVAPGPELTAEERAEIIARIQQRFAHIPRDVSLVDELLAERAEQARRENEE